MGLDVYYLSDKKMKNCLISLSDVDVKSLGEYICLLKEKTGVYIDPYGTTKLYPAHGLILLKAILADERKIEKNIMNFVGVIEESVNRDDVLIFDGD